MISVYLFNIGIVVIAGLLGMVAHELTHWSVAWLCRRPARINWRTVETVWRTGDGRDVRDYLIGLAPLSLGLGIGIYLFQTGTVVSLAGWIAWGIYTLNGSLADLRGGVETETESPTASS